MLVLLQSDSLKPDYLLNHIGQSVNRSCVCLEILKSHLDMVLDNCLYMSLPEQDEWIRCPLGSLFHPSRSINPCDLMDQVTFLLEIS